MEPIQTNNQNEEKEIKDILIKSNNLFCHEIEYINVNIIRIEAFNINSKYIERGKRFSFSWCIKDLPCQYYSIHSKNPSCLVAIYKDYFFQHLFYIQFEFANKINDNVDWNIIENCCSRCVGPLISLIHPKQIICSDCTGFCSTPIKIQFTKSHTKKTNHVVAIRLNLKMFITYDQIQYHDIMSFDPNSRPCHMTTCSNWIILPTKTSKQMKKNYISG